MKKLLFVSLAFPPKNDPECLQTAKYFRYLQEKEKFSIDVLTSAMPTMFMPYDENLEDYNQGFNNKIELKINENKYLNFIKRTFIPGYFEQPDSKKSFHLSWKKALKQIKEKPDIIYSRSFPLSSSLLAFKLKEYYKVPWVLHLSDPWAYCPITNYGSEKQLKYHRSLEKECFENCDYICLTSEKTIELYKNVYPQFVNKFLYFPNVFDPKDFKQNDFEFEERIKVVYTGGLIDERSVSYLIEAMKILQVNNPTALDSFDFVFAGAMDTYNKSFFKNTAFKNLTHLGLLPYRDALDLQRSADILLVIDNPIDKAEKAVFFPSKLLDYMLMQRNILAVTTPGGTSDLVIKSLGAISVSHADAEALATALLNIYEAHNMKDKSFFYREGLNEIYSAKYNANRLLQTLESLLK
jgi:glycosyltransferase involved in cell wall biosynthesis